MHSFCPSIGLKGHNISARLMYSFCPSIGLKRQNISARLRYYFCPSFGLKGYYISARLMYSYCPSIGLKGHINSTASCITSAPLLDWRATIPLLDSRIPTVPLLDWRSTISLQTDVFLLSPYWTEGAEYFYRLRYSCYPATGLKGHNTSARLAYSYCPSIGLKEHNITTDSCIPTVPLLDWRGRVFLQTHVFLLSRYWTEGSQYLYRLTYSYCPNTGLLLTWHSSQSMHSEVQWVT
jgi:hypothetical protein